MKRLALIAIMAIVTLTSCTTEQKIERQFKEYVQLNFNDPNTLVEVVHIEPIDTIDAQSNMEILKLIRSSIDSSLLTFHTLDSLNLRYFDVSMDLTLKKIERTRNRDKLNGYLLISHVNKISSDLQEWAKLMQMAEEEYAVKDSVLNTLMTELESIQESKLNSVTVYQVKYREKEGEDILMKSYYAYICNDVVDFNARENDYKYLKKNHKVYAEILGFSKMTGDFLNYTLDINEDFNSSLSKFNERVTELTK